MGSVLYVFSRSQGYPSQRKTECIKEGKNIFVVEQIWDMKIEHAGRLTVKNSVKRGTFGKI